MYCSVSDIEKYLNKDILLVITDDDKSGVKNDAVIEAAIRRADALIDAMLRSKFALPLGSVPALLGSLAIDIAIAELFARHPEIKADIVQKKYIEAIRTLSKIGEGEIELESEAPKSISILSESTAIDAQKHFSRSALEPF